MIRQLHVIVILYVVSQNYIYAQDFFQAQLSPSTLTSVPYLGGSVSVYEHKQNRSRLFAIPLAVLDTNQTKIHYNLLVEKHILTLPLVLYTNELRRTILDYLSHTQNRCSSKQEVCDISMVPTEHLRVLWTRTNPFSSNYKLDTTWQPNTALLNEFDVQIECPTILQYSTQTEKHTSKTVTITGHHLMKTKMFSALKQLPSATADNHER
ncbi:unnamed protein product [Adineta ricciae]|uniref:Uncharacterized protein n=1 Tax=Adineta ricciae TaxID=249248 RepID=A0A815V465_ADIRI|nr:unnamed protein product [Adineta ricciae]